MVVLGTQYVSLCRFPCAAAAITRGHLAFASRLGQPLPVVFFREKLKAMMGKFFSGNQEQDAIKSAQSAASCS